MTEPGKMCENVLISKTIIPNSLDNVPVRVLNVSDSPVHLRDGMLVAGLSAIVEPQAAECGEMDNSDDRTAPALNRGLVDRIHVSVSDRARLRLTELLMEFSDTLIWRIRSGTY